MMLPATIWLSSAHASDSCVPEDAVYIGSLIETLDAPLSPGAPLAYQSRIELLRTQVQVMRCLGPNPVPALFRTFLRSRYGSPDPHLAGTLSPLPEDPDLFEAALQALAVQSDARLREGAQEGLSEGLSQLVWSRMRHDWVRPSVTGLSNDDRRWVEHWSPPLAPPPGLRDLLDLLDTAPQATVLSMTTEGGSLLHDAVAPLQDGLLSKLFTDSRERPAVLRALSGVAIDSGIGGPHTAAAIKELRSSRDDPALARAQAHLEGVGPWGEVRPPAVLPGRIPGLEALDTPRESGDATVLRPSGPVLSAPQGWARLLTGGGLILLAGLLGARIRRARPIAGTGVAVGILMLTDGISVVAGAPTSAGILPLFSFIAQSEVRVQAVPEQPGAVWLGGGSMRLTVMDELKDFTGRRVAVLGASTVHGSHYMREVAFPAQVERQLLDVEVLNFGIGGATSAGVASAGRTALELGVDGLVIAYGHNEAAQFTRLALYDHVSPAQLHLRLLLSHSPIYTAMAQHLSPKSVNAPPNGLYRTAAPTREEVHQLINLAALHYRHHIGGLISEAQSQGVAVVLVIPPTNLRFAHLEPFDTPGPGDAADLDRLRREAEAAAQDGDGTEARALWQEAIDKSASPRELVSPIRDEIVRLGGIFHVPVVDAQAWYTAHAPDGVSPSGLFWDDVHPTHRGHTLLANLLAPVVAEELEP